MGDAVAIEVADADVDMAIELATQVGDREAALVEGHHLVAERLDHRVDEHGQRDRRLVRVARVVIDLGDRDPHRLTDLVGGKPGAARLAHRLDHVVDQALRLRSRELPGAELAGGFPEHRMADLEDGTDRHPRRPCSRSESGIGTWTPRSAATSIARS